MKYSLNPLLIPSLLLILILQVHIGYTGNGTIPVKEDHVVRPNEAIVEIITLQQSLKPYNCGFVKIYCNIVGNEKIFLKTMTDSGKTIFTFNKNEIDPSCEQININKIIIFDHLFSIIHTNNERIDIPFNHKETRKLTINVQNQNVYWERLDFTRNYNLSNKKILVIVGNDFDFLEYSMIPKYLEYYGAEITTASNQINRQAHYWNVTSSGAYKKVNTTAIVDVVLDSVTYDDFDCIFLPGGSGPANLLAQFPKITTLISDANQFGILLSAICHGPLLLAKSDVIKGKQVTGFPDITVTIQQHGGIFVEGKVVVDGNIITGNWPYFNSVATSTAENLAKIK
jgi:protease I